MKFREILWTSVFRFFAEKIKFRKIPWTSLFRFFAEKLKFAKFRGLPYSVFSRSSVFCSVFRFYAEKIKFRGISRNSVFRVPYLFRIFPQNSAKNTKRKRRNSGEFRAEFFKNFDGIYFRTELNLDFRYNTRSNIMVKWIYPNLSLSVKSPNTIDFLYNLFILKNSWYNSEVSLSVWPTALAC